jgi:hypothetical protein
MIAMVRALTSFVEERPIVARERRFYGALPYLLAKIVAEGPLDAFFAGLFGYMVHKLCHMNGVPRRFTFFTFFTFFYRHLYVFVRTHKQHTNTHARARTHTHTHAHTQVRYTLRAAGIVIFGIRTACWRWSSHTSMCC